MKKVFETVIDKGGFDLSVMLSRIDSYHIEGKLTDEERDVLYKKARGVANPVDSVDVMVKLMELEDRVKKLEQGESPDVPAEDYPEYVVGKWYYAGDKIAFNGQHYICIAPEGVVCTWSPDEYPAYWQSE